MSNVTRPSLSDNSEQSSVDLLWQRLKQEADSYARSQLIEHYTPLAKKISASLYGKRLSDDVEFNEFFQLALVGLIESIDRYQPNTGASFETFASYRIRGSILNGLEKMTEWRDQLASRARRRKERLESIAAHKESKKDALFDEMVEVALGLAIGFMLENTSLVRDDTKASEDQAYRAKELQQLQRSLAEAVEKLPQ